LDIGPDASTLDGLTVRQGEGRDRVVTNTRPGDAGKDLLRGALAIRGLADHRRAAVGLQAAGEELGRGGGAAVDEDEERESIGVLLPGAIHRLVALGVGRGGEHRPLVDEVAGELEGGDQLAARTAAQVEDQRGDAGYPGAVEGAVD